MELASSNKCHGGVQRSYTHQSDATGTAMSFSIFLPGHRPDERLPVLWFLSGLTCTPANVTEKGEFREACAEHGIILVAPDTSPRGDDVPDDEEYDFGKSAGFYLDATEQPWSQHFRMRTYLEQELPTLIAREFPVDMARQGITGHSMGGHGALTIALRDPARFRSVSAFAPIVSPLNCPWGEKALSGYLGADRTAWCDYDSCALIDAGARLPDLLVDQGDADIFLEEQLKPHLLAEACERSGQPLTLRMQPGYDHSFYFVSTFMADHVAWHAARLNGDRQ
ncbi:S-formylglutathione hydrolase [Sphingopyxis sp. GC21]|uniref:S-formylglutathione hydrolase n=1 Tax=Sphingopyxis sp. GC21 TaxID=2933562 RepID=UPI0021E422C3